jgi:hypothetical protein
VENEARSVLEWNASLPGQLLICRGNKVPVLQGQLDGWDQVKSQARLEHITESPGFNCSGDYIWVIMEGQEDNLGAPFSVFQPPGHFKTVQYRHRDIEYHNSRSQLYDSLKRRLTVTDCPNDVNSCANADTIVPSISCRHQPLQGGFCSWHTFSPLLDNKATHLHCHFGLFQSEQPLSNKLASVQQVS